MIGWKGELRVAGLSSCGLREGIVAATNRLLLFKLKNKIGLILVDKLSVASKLICNFFKVNFSKNNMNFSKLILAFVLFFNVQFANAQLAINSEKSEVTFSVSNLKFKKVKGSFSGMTGEINFDTNDLSVCGFGVCIDASTVNTENKKRDEHLKREDFFFVDEYPNICFESLKISETKKGFLALGELTMHGHTQEVEIPFTFDGTTFKGKLSVNRLDYKVGESTGKLLVGYDVELDIACVVGE